MAVAGLPVIHACVPQAERVLHDAIPALLSWLVRFRRPDPDQSAVLEVRGQEHGTCMEAVAVSEMLDIEESIWVPRYGLKGMIDASVQLRCQQFGPQGPVASPAQARHCFRQLSYEPLLAGPGAVKIEAPVLADAAMMCHASIMMLADAVQVYTAPLEFKSGRPHQSHRAQVRPHSHEHSQKMEEHPGSPVPPLTVTPHMQASQSKRARA